MKLNKLFMLGLAGLAFAACSSDEDPAAVNDNQDQALVISIAGISSGADTRTSDKWVGDTQDNAKDNVKKLTILLTDANGVLKYAPQVLSDENLTAAKGNGVKFIGVSGVTQVHAVANKDITLAQGGNISDLNAVLSDQGYGIDKATGVIYFGSDTNINPINPEPATEGLPEIDPNGTGSKEGNFYYKAEINLTPAISRIQINSIKVLTSGEVNFPAEDVGNITANKFKLAWSNFKPTLHGVYLNNFANKNSFFKGMVEEMKKNDKYTGAIKEGQWLIENADFATTAAYISYADANYGTLLNYASAPTTGEVSLEMPAFEAKTQCIAFNIFVNGTTANPTIHFQFAPEVTGYNKNITLAAGGEMTEEDKQFIATATTSIDYTLPQVGTGGFLFANISKLYEDANHGTELKLEPGKIYNMDVTISPVNMTIDLNNPQTYNVVVAITVVPFTEQTIYPGLGE